ncbi:hypothetical protein BJV74DRAFT_263358 [Russula compacta]|nr:hypothetical protein BJV74DRAFT_263358 [Russula compacta]
MQATLAIFCFSRHGTMLISSIYLYFISVCPTVSSLIRCLRYPQPLQWQQRTSISYLPALYTGHHQCPAASKEFGADPIDCIAYPGHCHSLDNGHFSTPCQQRPSTS